MKKLWYLLLLPVLLLIWWIVSHSGSEPTVHVAPAKRETISSRISTNGKTEPIDFAAARAEIPGFVQAVLVRRGQNAAKGQVLVTLDSASQRSAVETAQAAYAQAKAENEATLSGGKLAQVNEFKGKEEAARLQLADSQRRLDSVNRLLEKNAATRAEQLAAQTAVDSAKQQVESLARDRESLVAPGDKSVSESRLRDARTALELARHRLSLASIRSPMKGTIYQFGESGPNGGQGDVRPGMYLELGSLVAMVGNLDQMRVRMYVDEPDLGRVALGLPVEITWEAQPGKKWQGTVSQTPTEIVPLQSRQVGVVTCTIDNPNHELLPGTNIDALIIAKVVKDAVTIPKQALQTTAQGSGVWKLGPGNRIRWQLVKTGVSNVTDVEIQSGIAVGDKVVLPSDVTLSDGLTVRAEQ